VNFAVPWCTVNFLLVCCRVSQLFGRCGRDGKASEATLFVASDGQAFKCDSHMKTYCDAGSCLRMLHARYFVPRMSIEEILAVPGERDQRCCTFCTPVLPEVKARVE
jgi:hypothetical protein